MDRKPKSLLLEARSARNSGLLDSLGALLPDDVILSSPGINVAGGGLVGRAAVMDFIGRRQSGGVTLQIVRDWALKLNALGPDGLIDRQAPGQARQLNGSRRAAIAAIIESKTTPAIHGIVHWRIADLCRWFYEEFRGSVAEPTLSLELRAMGYRKLSTVLAIMRRPTARLRILKRKARRRDAAR